MMRVDAQQWKTSGLIALSSIIAAFAVWFWALPAMFGFISYMSPSLNPSDARMIRDLWSFRLIQPEWLSRASDHTGDLLLRWQATEMLVRTFMVFVVWVLLVAWIYRH